MDREQIRKELQAIGNIYHGLASSPSVGNQDYDNFVTEHYNGFIEYKVSMFSSYSNDTDKGCPDLREKVKDIKYIHNLDNKIININTGGYDNRGLIETIQFEGKYDVKEFNDLMQKNKYVQKL